MFARGFDPLQHKWVKPAVRSPWQRHFELGRANPGKWMKVSEVKRGGCKERQRAIDADRNKIHMWLERNVPLERWTLRQVTLAGTWCDRELWLRYDCELTPEEDREDRARRRLEYEQKQVVSKAKKERRAQEARDKAAEEEAAAQVRIRGRRRPGG